ncbi:tripartite tricarboxylate transporter substrate-binding protein, partial [Acinetobacter baumannii]|uniref:tripartite tricarboxylate transporter substrate-binding protein n=1 Tax=Acinetobacter baumannii TaxID=470 RepID=UPI0020913E6F
ASPGVGTSVHLLSELFRLEAGFEAVHVPYRGGAPAVNDLLGGHIDIGMDSMAAYVTNVQSNQLSALAIATGRRWPG